MVKKSNYKIFCGPDVNPQGQLSGLWIATLGPWSELGSTKKEALEKLHQALDWYFLDDDFVSSIRETSQSICILEKSFRGFEISRVEKGGNSRYGFSLGRVSWPEAEKLFNTYVFTQKFRENHGPWPFARGSHESPDLPPGPAVEEVA